MRILVACEESQRVCCAFRNKGHEAYSCDLQPCSGGHPEWHIMGNCLPLLNGHCTFLTEDCILHSIGAKWDMIIAHPPCTYLSVVANRWYNVEKYGQKAILRQRKRIEAIDFFLNFVSADCEKIAIENPVGVISTVFCKPSQIIQPYFFGEPYEKRTCLWLKNLPKLKPSNVVKPLPRAKFKSGKTMPKWYSDAWHLPPDERQRVRSRTFPGIAAAMAEQWGGD